MKQEIKELKQKFEKIDSIYNRISAISNFLEKYENDNQNQSNWCYNISYKINDLDSFCINCYKYCFRITFNSTYYSSEISYSYLNLETINEWLEKLKK